MISVKWVLYKLDLAQIKVKYLLRMGRVYSSLVEKYKISVINLQYRLYRRTLYYVLNISWQSLIKDWYK